MFDSFWPLGALIGAHLILSQAGAEKSSQTENFFGDLLLVPIWPAARSRDRSWKADSLGSLCSLSAAERFFASPESQAVTP
jgi:hypothetical protein